MNISVSTGKNSSIKTLRQQLDKKKQTRESLAQTREKLISDLESARVEQAALSQAQDAFQRLAQQVQQTAHEQIARLVDRCLADVFGADAYECRIEINRKRGKTEAEIYLLRNGAQLKPLDECGGGVVDVTAFALRTAALIMKRPKPRSLLLLDEPFKHLSKQYRPRAARLIQEMAHELGVQIILVTHDPALTTDAKVIEVS